MIKNLKFTDGTEMPVGTLYCIAKNYSKHAAEMDSKIPDNPSVFIKPPTSYIETDGIIKLPSISNLVHHEVELVVVIGKDCINISKDKVKDYIAGYAVGIDVTMRDIQKKAKEEGAPWAIAKGFATSAPISKIIPISKFENKIPYFDLILSVNGQLKQQGNTRDMERPVETLVEFLSHIFNLNAGDCIFTGTPEGVGPIMKGDIVNAELVGYADLSVKVE